MRLIDADALSKKLIQTTIFIKDGEVFQRMINDAPTVQADRPTGEWKGYKADNPNWLRTDGTPIFLVCDKCNYMVMSNGSANWNYCPNCGTRMEGGEDE